MSKRWSSKFGLALFYLVSTILIEIMTFALLKIGFLPKYYLYDFAFVLMCMGLIFIIPSYLAQYIVSLVFIIVQLLLTVLNYILYHLYGDVFSFDMIKLTNEAAKAVTSEFIYVWLIIFVVFLFLILALIGGFIYKNIRVNKFAIQKNFSAFMIMIVLVVQGLGLTVYTQQNLALSATGNIGDENYVLSDAFLRDTSMLKIASLKSLGTYGYYINNLMNLFTDNRDEAVVEKSLEYFKQGEMYNANSSNTFGVAKDENVIVIMMESLEWYAFSDGLVNSYNLTNELTPNICDLIKEGFIATDFFSKSKTNISEGIGFLGGYPICKYMSQVATSKNAGNFGFSIPNMLKKEGYTSYYLHANTGDYYSRRTTHRNLGFDYTYFGDDALDDDIKWGHWMKEADFVQSALDEGYLIPEKEKIDNGQKFYSFYTTLTTHGPYDSNANNMDQQEYLDYVLYGDDYDLPEGEREYSDWYSNMTNAYPDVKVQNYLLNYEASIVGLDRAIGVIVNKLKEYDIYDDTTILLYSDHNAYYHTMSNSIKGINKDNYSNIELNTVPFILKSKNLNERIQNLGYKNYNGNLYQMGANILGVLAQPNRYGNEINLQSNIPSTSKFVSAYDIVPTLLDLLGVEFNTRIYAGQSIFAPTELSVEIYNVNGQKIEEPVTAYYSHTGGVYGKFGNTKDLVEYDFYFPVDLMSKNYTTKFRQACKELLYKLNYISTLYNYGVYTRL